MDVKIKECKRSRGSVLVLNTPKISTVSESCPVLLVNPIRRKFLWMFFFGGLALTFSYVFRNNNKGRLINKLMDYKNNKSLSDSKDSGISDNFDFFQNESQVVVYSKQGEEIITIDKNV